MRVRGPPDRILETGARGKAPETEALEMETTGAPEMTAGASQGLTAERGDLTAETADNLVGTDLGEHKKLLHLLG